ncbi:hypothetical protein CAL7716_049610 [Calothrix sp. PCC 7716]|nr:hypothetical protein CAL7716_049610 [Calothrix sp. PCC 7716]
MLKILEDILITDELQGRTPRASNLQAENQALRALAQQLVNQPQTMLQSLVDIALELCQAGTAGVSLLEVMPNGEEVFRWNVLAGILKQHVGAITPRNFSLCSICLDHGTPQLFSHPEPYFTYYQAAKTPVVEVLVLPITSENHALGTIWIMSHSDERHFDSEDVRVMTSLADFAAALLSNRLKTQELIAKNAQLEIEINNRKLSEAQAHESSERLRVIIENLPGGAVFVVDQNLRYLFAEGEALSEAGFKPEDLVGHTISEAMPPSLVPKYEALYRSCLAGESFEYEHNAHGRSYISRGTPISSENGEIDAVLAISYDISARKQAEETLAADFKDMQLLRELSTRLVTEDDIQTLYQEIMAVAITLTRASAGTVQILDEATQDLLLLATQGFERSFTNHFYRVNASSNTSCGRALTIGERTFVYFDMPQSEDPDGSMQMHVDAGYLSAQSTPLIARSGKRIGMISTHWRQHRQPSERELRFLDLLARQAADLIEQRQAEAALRESEAKYRSLFETMDEGFGRSYTSSIRGNRPSTVDNRVSFCIPFCN